MATYIVTAENDSVALKKHSDKLIKRFSKEQLTTKEIPNTNHNNISDDEMYSKLMFDFVTL